jgi:hypothetical protein
VIADDELPHFWSAAEATPLWMVDGKQSKAVLLPPHSKDRLTVVGMHISVNPATFLPR